MGTHLQTRKRTRNRNESANFCKSFVLISPTLFLHTTMPSSLPMLLATFPLLSQCAPSSPLCSHQTPPSTSRWHQLVNSNQRQATPVISGSPHLTNLQDRLGELVEMITVRREGFCQDTLGQTFPYLDACYSSSSYEAILPAQALTLTTKATDWQTKVAVAYDTFQRIGLGLEVVRTDLEHHQDGSERVKQLWRRVEVQVQGVLVNLLTEMEVRGSTSSSSTLTMAALPPSLRCEPHGVKRNQRDFVILRHVFHAASFFTTTLNIQ